MALPLLDFKMVIVLLKFILKSEKGNVTVVMEKIDYEEKMLMLLADNKTYERINSKVNPLKSIEKELNKLLWQLVKEEKNN